MKQSLQLKLGQHLTMTPQLQQAIRLLQLSAMELSTEIQEVLDSNIMLEVADGEGDDEGWDARNAANNESATPGDDTDYEAPHEVGGGDPGDDDAPPAAADIPDELPVDTEWDEIYDTLLSSGSTAPARDDDGSDYERGSTAGESLIEHLTWQLNLLPMSDTDRAIALAIVDAIDNDGYLSADLAELCAALADEDGAPEEDEVRAVLRQVQSFDPVGVAARDLRECLILQLAQLDAATPWLAEAQRCCEDFMDLLGARDYNQLMRRLKLDKDQLAQVLGLIQTLNPRPGSQFSSEQPEYIVPDVFVFKHKDRWRVELNPDTMPALRINPYYASLIRRADSSDDNATMRAHMQEARWFIKSLQSRSETLLRVATAIVERQRAFLEHGEEAMRPLVLHDIAEVLELHESTISRVTTRKYMHTPRGIFELKYFFSSHVSTTLGGEASSTAIRAVIKKLIAAENNTKPLSDNKIAAILSEQGVQVARRTVAKYREAMSIPPSNERKRLA
ncbi:MAG: RNA polymerase factor sigma-54 [Gammaproteobacteria bacterium]|nr:RNA polymerase factor sigma-54 [Gammaproteobacteria bacterium]